jgi:hypothetical protein
VDQRLSGAYAKLDRADAHIKCLNDAFQGFLKERPYRVVTEVDEETGECVLRGQVLKRPPVLNWGVQIGECVHNLRSALDLLAWQLALLAGEEPPDNTAFPIFCDRDKYVDLVKESKRSVVRGLPLRAQERIDGFQPCIRREPPWADPLWIVHRLANDDKHRVLHVGQVAAFSVGYTADALFDGPIEAASAATLRHRFFDDDTELERLPATVDCADLANKMSVAFVIAFDKEGPALGDRLILELERCRDAVREVFPDFLDFFDG